MVDISSLSGLTNVAQQSLQKSGSKLQTAIASLITGKSATGSTEDVSLVSLATQLQSQVAVLKKASSALAQASSLTEVAGKGVSQIGDALSQLKTLAEQAQSPTLSASDRGALNQQFQQLVATINQTATSTTFGGKGLLDGSLSGDNAVSLDSLLLAESESGDSLTLSIGNLSTSSLFDGQSLDLLSADGASNALGAITTALSDVGKLEAGISAFSQGLGYAAANVDSAVFNQDAAASVLDGIDFVEGSTALAIANYQFSAAEALSAQTKRLPPSFLEILLPSS